MNQEQAKALIKETFQNGFNKTRFVRFIQEFLTGIDQTKTFPPRTGNIIRAAFRDRIASYERIGQYTAGDGKKVDILIVNLNRNTTLERGRTGLRNFAADYLQGDQGTSKEAVLLAYVSPDKNDWRFSFVTLETALVTDEDGKVRETIETITPARRKSFLVGEFEKTHTAQTRFLKWLTSRESPTVQEIEDCFDVESVTKEFFAKYETLFKRTRDAIIDVCDSDEKVHAEFINKGLAITEEVEKGGKVTKPFADDFAKKLLGQIVFLYFLQKKGWFGVARGADWGTGDKNYLRNLFSTKKAAENFFNDILEFLFYDALAVNRKHNGDFYGKLNCRIPFLNGGLFEPIGSYDWVDTDITLPDTLFSNKTSRNEDGDGILDVFDLYNFTISEAEPLETEVAVDPEMLGKIFENLLPENVRHGSGTYYTPRVIVAYMCQQSLINYLATHLSDVSSDDLEAFLRFGAQAADYTTGGTAKDKDKYLPESIRNNASKIDSLLQKITVCDPAIGSGAFPVGMMQEIVKAREALRGCEAITERSQYRLKRETIENCLYGVDIDPGAVEIAKLRLWLSLIVDEADYKEIEPLPNLDYKIMQGNSLLDEFHGVKLIDEKMFAAPAFDKDTRIAAINDEIKNLEIELKKANVGKQSPVFVLTERKIKELRAEKAIHLDGGGVVQNGMFAPEDATQKKLQDLKDAIKQFFGEADPAKKKKLRDEIENLEWEFIEAKLIADDRSEELAELSDAQRSRRKNYFLWHLNFPEVFQQGGFDVVIANPPYVQLQKDGGSLAKLYEKSSYTTFNRMGDIYSLFYERGWQILRSSGNLCFITSNKWMRAGYGENTRTFFAEKTNPVLLIDFAGQKIFESATVDTNILLLTKEKNKGKTAACIVREPVLNNLSVFLRQEQIESSFDQAGSWVILSPIEKRIKEKIERAGIPLKDWEISINYGIKTGFNDAFIVGGETRTNLIKQDSKSEEIIRPILRGRDIKRYGYTYADRWLINIHNGIKEKGIKPIDIGDYPAIKRHLDRFYPTLQRRADRGNTPYNLRNCAYMEDFSNRKIVWGNLNLSASYALAEEDIFVIAPCPMIVPGNRFILAILNSKLADYYIRKLGVTRNGGYFEYKPMFVEKLPVPLIPEVEQKKFHEWVDEIARRKATHKETKDLERVIDNHIFKLYDLTRPEIDFIERRKHR